MTLAGRVGGGLGRAAHAMLKLALGLLVLALLGAAVLAWHLSRGPVELGWLARRIEAAVNRDGQPSRLVVGGVSLAWSAFREGEGKALELRVTDARALGAGDAVLAEVARAQVALSVRGLVGGEAVPRSVLVEGARLRLLRAADGAITPDLGGLLGASPAGAVPDDDALRPAQLIGRLATPRPAGARIGAVRLDELRSVLVRDVQFEVADRQLGATWNVAGARADLRRPEGGGLLGTIGLTLGLGSVSTELLASAATDADGSVRIEASASPFVPAGLAGAAPALRGLAALAMPLALAGTAELSPELVPRRATLRATAEAGRAQVGLAAIQVAEAAAEVVAEWDGPALREVRLTRGRAVLPGVADGAATTVEASGTARPAEGGWKAEMAGGFDQVGFAELGRVWPAELAPNARAWVVGNITAGTARAGRIAASLAADADLAKVELTRIDAGFGGDDVTVHWLRPVPPIERVQATLSITHLDAIEVAATAGRQGPIVLRGGHVRISGLEQQFQAIAINLEVAGAVADTIALLRHPRLRLLDRQRLTLRNPGGTLEGRVALRFPLINELAAEQIDVRVAARTDGLRLAGIAGGKDLERAALQLDVTQDGLKATGPATVAGIAGQLAVELDFRGGPPSQVLQRVTLSGRATARQLAAADLDMDWAMQGGQLGIAGTYAAQRDGRAELRARADLRDATLAGLGWSKAAGVAGEASARLVLQGDRLVSIEELRAQAPGLRVEGRSEIANGKPSLLLLDRIELGLTRAAGEVRLAARRGESTRAVVSGPLLDLSDLLSAGGGAKGDDQPGAPWAADVVFDRVLLGKGRGLNAVSASVRSDGVRIRSAAVESGAPERLRVSVVPQGGNRQISVRAADAGALLRAFDVTDTVLGGQLALTARADDTRPDSPLDGTAELADFGVRQAQLAGKILQGLTVYGLIDAANGPGLAFTKLVAPFRWERDVLDVRDVRAFSASLGVTAKGQVDLGRRTAAIEGTIVPAYVLNTALGRLPLVGRLFSPEQGGGLLSMAYTVRGPLDDPAVAVNPLSALTPGALRGLFKIFD